MSMRCVGCIRKIKCTVPVTMCEYAYCPHPEYRRLDPLTNLNHTQQPRSICVELIEGSKESRHQCNGCERTHSHMGFLQLGFIFLIEKRYKSGWLKETIYCRYTYDHSSDTQICCYQTHNKIQCENCNSTPVNSNSVVVLANKL